MRNQNEFIVKNLQFSGGHEKSTLYMASAGKHTFTVLCGKRTSIPWSSDLSDV